MTYNIALLIKRRKVRGLSQAQLAAAAEVTQATVSNVEAGNTENAKTIKKLADALGLQMTKLIVRDIPKTKPIRRRGMIKN